VDPATIFLICNNAVLPFWALLILAPRWSGTDRIVHAAWAPAALAVVYLGSIAMSSAPEGAGFGSLAGVMLFFTSPEAALAGWIHYLAFDLFVGAWEARDAQRNDVPHLVLVPCLVLTLALGPVGLGLYLGARGFLRRTGSLRELAV